MDWRRTKRLSTGLFLLTLLAGASFGAANDGARLADAAQSRDQVAVRTLLKQKVDVNAAQADGTTALHWAADNDDLIIADLLIGAGANVKAETRYGLTPLYMACLNGSAAMIQKLLAAGADPNTANRAGETALMTASRTGKVDAVKVLLDHGATLNNRETVRGQTALMWAVLEDHPDVVKLLLAKGADINMHTEVKVPDGVAVIPGPAQASGAGVSRQRALPSPSGAMTALLFASRDGLLDMVKILLDAKADINAVSANGTTPLIIAVINNHMQLAMELIARGANPNIVDFYGRTPLIAAVDMRNLDHARTYADPKPDAVAPLDVISALLAHGADPNLQTQKTPVRGFFQGDMSWVSSDGQTPFLRAGLSGDVTVMKMLLEHGANPNISTKEGTTVLMTVAGINWVTLQTFSRSDAEYLEAAKLCLDHGADVNAVNAEGFTAMHGAANRGFDAMVRLLASHGAKLDVKDKQGRTPMTFAHGVFLAGYPPQEKPSTVALLHELMGDNKTSSTAGSAAGVKN